MIANIRLSEFKIHAESEYAFSPGINAIVGPGGCGKTSIMEAIGWAAFGSMVGKKSDFASLVSDGDSAVELSMEIGDCHVQINKFIAGYSSLHIENRMIAEGEMPVREAIADLVGYNRLDILFSNLVGITQGFLDGVFSKSTSERVKVFSKILNIDKYREFSDWLLIPYRDLGTMIEVARGALSLMVEERVRNEKITTQYHEVHGKVAELSVEIARQKDIREDLKKDLDFIADIKMTILLAKQEIDRLTGSLPDHAALTLDVEALDELHHCPTCNLIVDDDENRCRIRRDLSGKLERYFEIRGKIDGYRNKLIFDEAELLLWSKIGTDLKHEAVLAKIASLTEEESVLRGQMEILATSTDVDVRIEAKEAELENLVAVSVKLNAIRCAARKLPALIAVDTTDTVSGLATEFARMIYQNWSITWNEDFSIAVRIGEMELSFAQLSKSQKSIAALSVILALARLVSPMGFILLDEPFANMDGEQVSAVAGAIKGTGWFEQVILTTHRSEVEHIFDNVIEVDCD